MLICVWQSMVMHGCTVPSVRFYTLHSRKNIILCACLQVQRDATANNKCYSMMQCLINALW
jgi:hypothetical protein